MPQKQILTLFGLSPEGLPDNSFTTGISEVTKYGDFITNYHKDFEDKTFWIFNEIEVKKIGDKSRNVFFKSDKLNKVSINAVKKMINEIYEIYGVDDHNRGLWTDEDFELFNDKEFYALFGRRWAGVENDVEFPCAVGIDKEENTIALTIWGV